MNTHGFIDVLLIIFIGTAIALLGLGGGEGKDIKTRDRSAVDTPIATPVLDVVKKKIVPTPYSYNFTPTPVTASASAKNVEYFCTVPCGGMAGEASVQNNCAKFTTQEQCTTYRYTDYPFSCSWQASGYQCPAYP